MAGERRVRLLEVELLTLGGGSDVGGVLADDLDLIQRQLKTRHVGVDLEQERLPLVGAIRTLLLEQEHRQGDQLVW